MLPARPERAVTARWITIIGLAYILFAVVAAVTLHC